MNMNPLLRCVLTLLVSLPLASCRNELPVEVPVSSQTSSLLTRIYDDEFHPRYDINGTKGEYIVERVGLYPRQATASDPSILLIDPKAHEAITRGDSCLRMTQTNVENTWMDFFYYSLESDPNYAYDPDRPDCWEEGGDANGWGQDWSQYTHFLVDMWINPEKPLHNHAGWWAQIGVFSEMGATTALWSRERGDVGWDTYYWQHTNGSNTGGSPSIGPMRLAYKLAVTSDPIDGEVGNRWTRLGQTGFFSFILGGDQINMIFGGELYIDNIRVVRLEKPFWESFDFMAQHLEYDENDKMEKAVGFSNNEYCYSPCNPDYSLWVADRPHGIAIDGERAALECP